MVIKSVSDGRSPRGAEERLCPPDLRHLTRNTVRQSDIPIETFHVPSTYCIEITYYCRFWNALSRKTLSDMITAMSRRNPLSPNVRLTLVQ